MFGSFCKINEPNILFGPLISENSIVTPPLVKLFVQVQFFSVWITKWHIVTLLKNIQLSPSMICLMSLKAPLASRVAHGWPKQL